MYILVPAIKTGWKIKPVHVLTLEWVIKACYININWKLPHSLTEFWIYISSVYASNSTYFVCRILQDVGKQLQHLLGQRACCKQCPRHCWCRFLSFPLLYHSPSFHFQQVSSHQLYNSQMLLLKDLEIYYSSALANKHNTEWLACKQPITYHAEKLWYTILYHIRMRAGACCYRGDTNKNSSDTDYTT